ncbi:MAG: patatin, partial [Mesorhizobium sp.]
VRYRCELPPSTVSAYRGSSARWNCRDVRLVVQHLSFADLDPATQAKLNEIPTRLRLPVDQVDLTIDAGRRALEVNPDIHTAEAN